MGLTISQGYFWESHFHVCMNTQFPINQGFYLLTTGIIQEGSCEIKLRNKEQGTYTQ